MMLESRLRRFKKERIAEFEKETGEAFNPDDATHAQYSLEVMGERFPIVRHTRALYDPGRERTNL